MDIWGVSYVQLIEKHTFKFKAESWMVTFGVSGPLSRVGRACFLSFKPSKIIAGAGSSILLLFYVPFSGDRHLDSKAKDTEG